MDKLVKTLESLRILQSGDDARKKDLISLKKDKVSLCNILADCVCAPTLKNHPEFPKCLTAAFEALFSLCDDSDSDVRMAADDCMNRCTKTLLDSHLGRLQVEFYREIKKGSASVTTASSRLIRAALSRFADTAHLIRPNKRRAYAQNLLPCIGRIAADRLSDEAMQETLLATMNKIAPVLVTFMSDQEMKALCKPFLNNLFGSVATARRTAASVLVLVSWNSRSSSASSFAWLLDQLFDLILPIVDGLPHVEAAVPTVLGALLCIRQILAQAAAAFAGSTPPSGECVSNDNVKSEELLSERHVLMVYESLLRFIGGGRTKDLLPPALSDSPAVMTAALEALLQLLRSPPPSFAQLLVTRGSITKSHLEEAILVHSTARHIQIGAAVSANQEDSVPEAEATAVLAAGADGSGSSDAASGSSHGSRSSSSDEDSSDDEAGNAFGMPSGKGIPPPPPPQGAALPSETSLSESVTGLELADAESMTTSASDDQLKAVLARRWRNRAVSPLSEDQPEGPEPALGTASESGDAASERDVDGTLDGGTTSAACDAVVSSDAALATAATAIAAGCVGYIMDATERPAVHCARLLAARFLLGGCSLRALAEGSSPAAATSVPATLEARTLSDQAVRVSMKALALGCLAHVTSRCPDLLGLPLYRSPLPPAPPADEGVTNDAAPGSTATTAAAAAAAAVLGVDKQLMSDVLLFAQHHDPQLQGNVAVILGAALCGLAQLPCTNSARDRGGTRVAVEGEQLQQTVAHYAGELVRLLCSIKNSVATRLALSALGACLPALIWSVHCRHALPLLAVLERHVGDSYWLVKVELLDVLAAVDFRAVDYLERSAGPGRACSGRAALCQDATSATGPLPIPSLQDRLLYRVLVYRLLGDDDARVRHAAARCLVRLLPNLFFADDSPLHDPVVAHAQCNVAGLLSPATLLLGASSKPLPAVVHGLTSYYAPAFDRVRGADELRLQCSLSRLVSTLLNTFAETSSRSLKVGICHALCQLSQHYAATRYAIAWGCACGSSLRTRPSADSSAAPGAGAKEQLHHTGLSTTNRAYQPASSMYSGRQTDASLVYRSVSIEEPKMSGGGGPLSLVLSLLTCSTTFALDLAAHADALQLAGNLFAGAACSSLMHADGKKHAGVPPTSPEQTKSWPALHDRSLVPAVEKLLGHVARVLNILTQIIEDVTPGTAGTFPKAAVFAAIQTASQAAVSTGNSSPLKKLVAATRGSPSPDSKAGNSAAASGRQVQPAGMPGNLGTASSGQLPPKTPKEVEKELKTKREVLGSFQSLPHYMKIYEVVRGAYSNYKVSLDLSTTDKFSSLLGVALEVLGQILEVASLDDTAKCAEELLAYLKTSASIDPTRTMVSVHQLLKAMFGTNLASQCSGTGDRNAFLTLAGLGDDRASRTAGASSGKPGVYSACFSQPYACLSQSLATGGAAAAVLAAATPGSANASNGTRTLDDDVSSAINVLRRRIERKTPLILKLESKIDKGTVAAYIRLFEPLVIRALKAYMVTGSAELQRQVLDLLTQLVQLRVNYCLLDHEQIFLGFVIKQIEMLGEGPQGDARSLISSIFGFLVSLSYEKFHSKSVIVMPKIIQLCDGVLASGQDPRSYAIPALDMIVYDLFLIRGASASKSPDGGKDLDAQREVVVSMLLRLASFCEVAELLVIVLHQCFKESEDKWKKMSRLVVDTMLPLLAKQKVNADTIAGLQSLHRLMQAVSPSVYRPVDAVLKAMFAQPADLSTTKPVQQWLSAVLVLLRVLISQGKEEVMLSRLSELKLSFATAVPTYSGGGGGGSSYTSVASATSSTPGSVAGAHVLSGMPACTAGLERGIADGEVAAISALMYDSHSSDQSSTIQQALPEDLFASFLVLVISYVSARLETDLLLSVGNADEHSTQFTVTQLSHLMLYASYLFQSGHFRRVTRFLIEHLRDSTSPFYYQVQQLNEKLGGCSAIAARHPLLVLQWRHLLILLDFDDQSWWYDVVRSSASAAVTATVQTMPSSPEPGMHDGFEASTAGNEMGPHDGSAIVHGLRTGGGEDALFESTTSFEGNTVLGAAQYPSSINEELIRRGTLMLFCDYVVDNMQHAEQTTWLIVNHVSDLIDLCCEVPVQDFISAVHRNPAASGLFVHAVHSRYQFAGQLPSRGKRALACLRSAHTSQSGALLSLLLDKFLLDEETRHTSLARLCDSVACRRLEILLAEPVEQVLQQLAAEDVKRLLYYAKSPLLAARHCRLLTLLEKLAAMLQPFGSPNPVKVSGSESESDTSASGAAVVPTITIGRALSTGAADEPVLPPSGSNTPLVPVADKESFLAVVDAESCHRTGISPEDMSANASVCASLLGQLEYSDIVATMAREDFQLSVLAECMETSVSASTEFLQTSQEGRESGAASAVLSSPLFRASQDTVLSRIARVAAVVSTMPGPCAQPEASPARREAGVVVSREAAAFMKEKNNSYLVAALGTYLSIMRRFGRHCGAVPERSWHVICQFVVFTLGALHWQLLHHRQKKSCLQHATEYLPSVHEVKAAVTVLAEVLHHDQLFAVLCIKGDSADDGPEVSALAPPSAQVATVVMALHEIVAHYTTCIHGAISSDEHRSLWKTASVEVGFRASELVQCLSSHLSEKHDCLPSFLRHPLASAIQGLTRHPFVSHYAHIPLRAWTAGQVSMVPTKRSARVQDTDSDIIPVLASGALQDAALLKDYVQRVNSIGWCSRQQFEETWVTFLQFVSASSIGRTASNDDQAAAGTATGDGQYEEDCAAVMEQTMLAVVALRAIIGLLMRTALPLAVSKPPMWPWTALGFTTTGGLQSKALAHILGPAVLKKRLPFMDTVSGLKLQRMHKLIELQLRADTLCCGDHASESCVPGARAEASTSAVGDGTVEDKELTSTSMPLLGVMEKSETELPEKDPPAPGPPRDIFIYGGSKSSVDVQSCLRLLTDAFGDWLAAAALVPSQAQMKQPLMLINEAVRTLTILSDLFTTTSQYEWMYDVFSNLQRSQYAEDELMGQYIIHGLAKSSAAVISSPPKLDGASKERLSKVIEQALKSNHVPTKMSALSGSIYLLSTKDADVVRLLLPVVVESARQQLDALDRPIIFSEDNSLVLWSAVFYILETFPDHVKNTELWSQAIEVATKKMNAQEENMTVRILSLLVGSLERLVVTPGLLSADERDMLAKSACDRLSQRHPQHALIALRLLLSCMYSEPTASPLADVVEGRLHTNLFAGSEGDIVARMEQITVLFDRIRKGYPHEAQVVAQLLPTLLNDFFTIQDVMNKVIGEFLSSQQPHPQLLARVVFKVFEDRIVVQQELQLVQDWVMLSLGNFTQRTPLSMALWSLACFFVSASANQWLRAMFPHVVSSMGRADGTGERMFLMAALDFYFRLPSDTARRSFVATFQAAAATAAASADAAPYSRLLIACAASPIIAAGSSGSQQRPHLAARPT